MGRLIFNRGWKIFQKKGQPNKEVQKLRKEGACNHQSYVLQAPCT